MVHTQAREDILVQDRGSWAGKLGSAPPPSSLGSFHFAHGFDSQTSIPRGVVDISRCLSIKGAEDVINKAHAFELSTNTETMFFIADSDKVRPLAPQSSSLTESVFDTSVLPRFARISNGG